MNSYLGMTTLQRIKQKSLNNMNPKPVDYILIRTSKLSSNFILTKWNPFSTQLYFPIDVYGEWQFYLGYSIC